MKPEPTRADRIAGMAAFAIAAANALFFLAFFGALLLAPRPAAASPDPACKGTNLLTRMEAEDPATMERIRREADAVPNGKGILWRVEREGVPPSYLMGTMHMADPRVLDLGEETQAALEESSNVVIETTDALDQSKIMAAMLARPELMMFTDDRTLSSLLRDEDRATVEAALRQRGISLASINKMKPWMVSSMLTLPACERARHARGERVLDAKIADDAQQEGKTVEGLETAEDQLLAMASIPLEFHMQGLVETLALGDRIDDAIETMIQIYLDGDTGLFWPFLQHALPSSSKDSEASYAAFEERMVVMRNETMARGALPYLEKGNAFIAVGALHLPGDTGLVEAFRKAGFDVTRAD